MHNIHTSARSRAESQPRATTQGRKGPLRRSDGEAPRTRQTSDSTRSRPAGRKGIGNQHRCEIMPCMSIVICFPTYCVSVCDQLERTAGGVYGQDTLAEADALAAKLRAVEREKVNAEATIKDLERDLRNAERKIDDLKVSIAEPRASVCM